VGSAPFSGKITDTHLFRSGKQWSDKGTFDQGSLEAVPKLLSENYKLRRTIYLASGQMMKKVGGANGAAKISAYLKD